MVPLSQRERDGVREDGSKRQTRPRAASRADRQRFFPSVIAACWINRPLSMAGCFLLHPGLLPLGEGGRPTALLDSHPPCVSGRNPEGCRNLAGGSAPGELARMDIRPGRGGGKHVGKPGVWVETSRTPAGVPGIVGG